MAAKSRDQAIKQMVANDKKVTVSNLSGIFQVTEETIRRDLEKLEDERLFDQNLWWRCFKYSDVDGEYPFYKRASSFYEQKSLSHARHYPLSTIKPPSAISVVP
ncbi:DeoR family transcriptional regulator [Escherichia coli]